MKRGLGIDLGTANTLVYYRGVGVVIDEPSVVAIDVASGNVLSVGEEAAQMIGRTPDSIHSVRPLKDGVVADYQAASAMLEYFIHKVIKQPFVFKPDLVICVPNGVTEVEKRALVSLALKAGSNDKGTYLIEEPMASAIGAGLDVMAPKGSMVVDIGGGTTEIAVISLGGLVVQDSIRTAGDVFTSDIQYYLRQQHNIKVGEITAEKIKMAVGAVIPDLTDEEEPEPFIVRGPNLMTAHPVEATITHQEIAHCLDKSIARLETSIQQVLEQTPPELYSDIVENGIFLSGGGALLRGLDKRLSDKVNIPFHVAEDPLRAVARGTCIALKNTDNYSFLMR